MTTPVNYSPSIQHQLMMKNMTPSLAYDGGDVRAWQQRFAPRLAEVMGLDLQIDRRVPLNVRSLWTRPHEHGTIEKIVFTAEPGSDVPAYVCLPKGVKPPYKFFICLQGHSTGMHNSIGVTRADETQPQPIEGDRDFGIGCIARGVAALCIEQRSFGERGETSIPAGFDYLCHQAVVHAMMLGRTLIGERVFDVDRGIDYLESRGDVDMSRVGVMGNSGGGTVTMFCSLLPRLRLAMPSCCFSTFRQSLMSIFHCMCNYLPGLYPLADMADVVGLYAPRPVVVVSGKEDGIFPLSGARSEFARLKSIYEGLGAGNKCKLVEGNGGHRFYADDAWPVMLGMMK